MKNMLEHPILKEMCNIIDNMYRLGWDERNGGNVSYLLKEEEIKDYVDVTKVIRTYPVNFNAQELKGYYILMTGTGKYFRNTKADPETNLGLFRISEDGCNAELIWGYKDGGRSSSETYAHLMCHIERRKVNPNNRVVLHSHPTSTLALTHIIPNNDKDFTLAMWRVMTECIVVFPEGISVMPWRLCGTYEIGVDTANRMKDHRLVIWGLHGIYGCGDTFDEAFGLVETVEKAAEVYLKYLPFKELNTITDENLKEVAGLFKITPHEGYLK